MLVSIVLISLVTLLPTGFSEIGCRDEDNKLVDWYYLYKLPEEAFDHHTETTGLHYTFITSRGPSSKWQLSERSANESDSIPGRTLEPVLASNGALLTLLYNDEPPEGRTDGSRGHTKGVVATDGTTGFWLVHSVPKYPPELGQSYSYPNTGRMYGQSFLCISVASDQMDLIGQQLILNEPHVYSFNVPKELAERFPKLVEATKMKVNDNPPHWNAADLKSRNGVTFHSFAKNRFFNKELYADLIAPALQVDLLVESWQHGAGNLPSDCSTSQWHVMNVKQVEVTGEFSFATLKDHSKWAVSAEGDKDFVCVGDINRQEHQKVRGGGSVCSGMSAIANVYRGTVEDVEGCPRQWFKVW